MFANRPVGAETLLVLSIRIITQQPPAPREQRLRRLTFPRRHARERDGDGLPLYLAPYWVPRRGFRAAFEYVGYFVGSGAAFARVPRGEREAAEALFARCRGLLGE